MDWKYFAALFFLIIAPAANADILINEVMYAPNSNWGGQYNEWVELYNNGTEDINVTSWVIDGKTIPVASVPTGGFLILARNSTKFQEIYGTPSIYVPFTYGLLNAGEILNISSNNAAIDVFDYAPYANLAENNNHTLERNGSGWLESTAVGGTPGAQNSVFSAPPARDPVNETENTATNTTDTNTTSPANTAEENTVEEETNTQNLQQNQESDEPATIEILGRSETMNFGGFSSIHARFNSGSKTFEAIRFVAYIYKPSWISRDLNSNGTTLRNSPYNSNAAAEVPGISANETYYLVLPLYLKCSTEGYAETSYTTRVRAYGYENGGWNALAESDTNIFVSEESESCKKEVKECAKANDTVEKECEEKIKILSESPLEINIMHPEIVFAGENFTTAVFVKNNGETLRDIEIYSYMYEHSTIISSGFDGTKWGNARTANSRKITLDANDSITIELLNRARENASAEKYTYKVRFDDLADGKKSEERISLVELSARNASETNGMSEGIKNETISNETEKENKITGNLLAKNTLPLKLSLFDRIIYKIKSWLV